MPLDQQKECEVSGGRHSILLLPAENPGDTGREGSTFHCPAGTRRAGTASAAAAA